jgi:hypothetical protein
MPSLNHLLVRDESNNPDDSSSSDHTMSYLLITLLVLVLLALFSMGTLYLLKRHRNALKESELPQYSEKPSRRGSHQRHLAITSSNRSESIYVYEEKRDLMNEPSPPQSPVPEIRITFPEEVDSAGKRQSGKVVVVRVGETSVGMEPVSEVPPPYQHDTRFQSLDLDRIGGLKERELQKETRWN